MWNPELRELIYLQFSHYSYMQEFVTSKTGRIFLCPDVLCCKPGSQNWKLSFMNILKDNNVKQQEMGILNF